MLQTMQHLIFQTRIKAFNGLPANSNSYSEFPTEKHGLC